MVQKITWQGDLKFTAEWNGLKIHSQETKDMKDLEAMPPGAIFASSLGLCTASRIIGTCNKNNWTVRDLSLSLDYKVNLEAWRVDAFILDIDLDADLTDEEKELLYKEAHGCFVHRSIKHVPEIKLNINYV